MKAIRYYFLLFLIITPTFSCNFSIETNKNRSNQENKDSILKNTGNIDFSYISSVQSGNYSLPFIKYLFENTREIPNFSQSINNTLLSSKNNIQTLIHHSFQLLNASAGGFGPPLRNTKNNIQISNETELLKFIEQYDLHFNKFDLREWNKLPFGLKKEVVELIITMLEAKFVFDQFSQPIKTYLQKKSAFTNKNIYKNLIIPWKSRELTDFSSIDLINQVDLKKLSFTSRTISEKLNRFIKQQKHNISESFSICIIKSGLGEILISGTKNDTIKNDYALIIELGGNDMYLGNTAASISIDNPFGIVIDFSGHDKYICKNNFLVAGILGIGILLDLKGDDFYHTENSGLAFSLYGTSLLYDLSGKDTYISNSKFSQASSYIGSSIFIDYKGDDNYKCKSYSQAFASTLGIGVFIDYSGNDFYNIDSCGFITSKNSMSFIQGASKGRWAEATDGQSLSGGIGIFIDNSGDDKYCATGFSQGASYFLGLGLFADNKGNDEYNAISHSQGYAAHYALAGFFENEGDDVYNAKSDTNKITQIIGSGRDLSMGWFVDSNGNDIYHFGNRSAGIGDMNGIGIMWDKNGKDKYILHKNKIYAGSSSLGKSVGLSNIDSKIYKPKNLINLGVFIDATNEK